MYGKMSITICAIVIGIVQITEGHFVCDISDSLIGRRITRTRPDAYQILLNDCTKAVGAVGPCKGDLCSTYVQCYCTNTTNGVTTSPPGTPCWKQGRKTLTSDGKCDTTFPIGTAVTIFQNGRMTLNCGAFLGCDGDNAFKLLTQQCFQTMQIVTFGVNSVAFANMYAIEVKNVTDTTDLNPDVKAACLDYTKESFGCDISTGYKICKQ